MRRETRSIGFVKWWCVLLLALLLIVAPRARAIDYVYDKDGVMLVNVEGPAWEEKEEMAGAWTGNVNLFIGAKLLDGDYWRPVEDQFTLGVGLDFRPPNCPISLVLDWSYSWAEESESVVIYDPWLGVWMIDVDIEGRTMEIDPGIRYIYEGLPYIRPFIGAGLALVWAEFEGSTLGITLSEDDWGIGFWAGGGAYVTLAEHLNLGFQVKYSYAKVELFDLKGKAGGWHLGGLIGYHW